MVAITWDMDQTATYWAPGALSETGRPAASAPVAINCRWQNKVELVRDPSGREVVSNSIVYPDQELSPEGWLSLGDDTSSLDPQTVSGARQIIASGSSPDLDSDDVLYKVWL